MTTLTASIQPHPQNHIFSQKTLFLKGIGKIRKILHTFHPWLSLSLIFVGVGLVGFLIYFQDFSNSHQKSYCCEKMWFWGCGWIEAVSAVILLRVLCREVNSFCPAFSRMCFFTICFYVFFDLTGTFQVQPLSGKGWWYAYNFDWYPKCPKWSTLSRNVSICVFPVPVFRPHHPSLSWSLHNEGNI